MGKASKRKPKAAPAVPSESAAAAPPAASAAALLPTARSSAQSAAPRPLATDVGSLRLLQRDTGTEWVFAERAANAPPLAAMPLVLQRLAYAANLGGADPEKYWWWITDDALAALAAELRGRHYCVVDGLLGEAAAATLRREVQAVRAAGGLALSKLAGGRTGKGLSYSHSAVRGDWVGWFDGDEQGHWAERSLSRYLQRVDTLMSQLAPLLDAELAGVASRSKAMVAAYPGGGARYVRHCDNACLAGEGEKCNGRRLTAILYLNPGWRDVDGGALRLFAPRAPRGVPPVADVEPLNDRLVLFYADYRVPHEVLAAHSDRLAITLWYFDGAERERAQQRGTAAAAATDAAEAAAIAGEIERFEARFGAADEVRRVVADPESEIM